MLSKVYLIKASVDEGEKTISQKARRLFRAGGFADRFKENDITAVKVHVGEGDNNTYVKSSYLKGLVDELAEAGVARDKRSFKAHLTLGRVKQPPGPNLIRQMMTEYATLSSDEFTCDQVILFKSDLKPSGAVYTKLKQTELE